MYTPGIKSVAANMIESRSQQRISMLKICKLCAAQLICVTGVDLHMSTAAAHTRGRHVDIEDQEGIEASHRE